MLKLCYYYILLQYVATTNTLSTSIGLEISNTGEKEALPLASEFVPQRVIHKKKKTLFLDWLLFLIEFTGLIRILNLECCVPYNLLPNMTSIPSK